MMPRWRVDYLGKELQHLGTVEAADEKAAIAEAARAGSGAAAFLCVAVRTH